MCQAPPGRTWALAVAGRTDCPAGFGLDYAGYLMAETHNSAGRSEFVCVDGAMEGVGGSGANDASATLYPCARHAPPRT